MKEKEKDLKIANPVTSIDTDDLLKYVEISDEFKNVFKNNNSERGNNIYFIIYYI